MHDEVIHKNLSLRKDNTYFLSKMVLFSFVHHSRKVVSDKKQVIFNDAAFLVFFLIYVSLLFLVLCIFPKSINRKPKCETIK